MKKSIFFGMVTIAVMFAVTGCGKKDKAQGTGASSTASVAEKKANIAARKKVFETKIATLAQYGLDVNKTKEEPTSAQYLMEVKDPQKIAQTLLVWLNAGNTLERDRKKIAKLFGNIKYVGLDVDWVKYAENKPQSVFVYLVGSGKEKEPVRSLMQQKTLGAYLSYNEKEKLTEVDVKDIDKEITDGNRTLKVALKGAKALISKMPTIQDPTNKMHLVSGTFSLTSHVPYVIDVNKTSMKTLNFSYADGRCDVNKSNSYLGEITCTFPSVALTMEKQGKKLALQTAGWKITTLSTAKNGEMQSRGSFEIAKIKVATQDHNTPTTTTLNKLKLKMDSTHIDESLIQALRTLATTPQKDSNLSMTKTMKILGDMFSKGMTIDYLFSIASIEGEVGNATQSKKFKADAIEEKGAVSFTKTYDLKDMFTVKNVSVSDGGKGTTLFELKGLRFGTQVAKLYNFVPGFMEFSGAVSQDPEEAELTAEEKKKLLEIGMNMVHNGFSMAYSPLSIEKLKIAEAKVDYGKMQLDLNATLKPNRVTVTNSMSAMQLLAFLQADGKVVLHKADLESMANSFSPKMMAMLMMYAKYEGDKAVFVLKFDKGHLLINGKPVM